MKQILNGYSYTDDETVSAVKEVYEKYEYIIDPHGAIGYLALKDFNQGRKTNGIVLETAHYAKFKNTMDAALGFETDTPSRLATLLDKKKVAVKMEADYEAFKSWLI